MTRVWWRSRSRRSASSVSARSCCSPNSVSPGGGEPERLLRECKKLLLSKQIFFTGGGDRKHVVQLLFDFEDLISVEIDQKRAKHLNLLTEDLERAHAEELGEARRLRSRKLLQRLPF